MPLLTDAVALYLLAMQAFLITIDPDACQIVNPDRRFDIHRLPVETAFVLDAAAVWELGEVHSLQQRFQLREEFMETGRVV